MFEDPGFWKENGLLGGLLVGLAMTVLLNIKQIGAFLAGVLERRLKQGDTEFNRQQKLEEMFVGNGIEARNMLIQLYDRLLQKAEGREDKTETQARLDRLEMQRLLSENHIRQEQQHAMIVNALEANTHGLRLTAEAAKEVAETVRAGTASQEEIHDSLIELKAVMEQVGFVNSQLIFWLANEKGVPVSLPVVERENAKDDETRGEG